MDMLLAQVMELCRLLAAQDGVFDAQPGKRVRSNASSPSVQVRPAANQKKIKQIQSNQSRVSVMHAACPPGLGACLGQPADAEF